MMRRMSGPALILILGLALAGCATAPTYPLMTPIQVAGDFGYDERPLGGNHYEVSYVTPPTAALGYRLDVSPAARSAKNMAFDLASLRAAQLAQQSGWQGFDILEKHYSSDTDYLGPAWDPGWGPGWGWGWGWHRWGWWGGPDDYWYDPPQQRVQAQAKLTIEFVNQVKPGQYRAADVIQQVGTRYPGVLTPPPGTAAPPPVDNSTAAQPVRPTT